MTPRRSTWRRIALGDVATFTMGQAPPGGLCNDDGIGTPFYRSGEFGAQRPVLRKWTTKPLKIGSASDVFICVVGANCGECNLGADGAIGRSIAAISPSESLDRDFLFHYLTSRRESLNAGSQGSAQGVITRADLRSVPLLLPPLDEQRRIVDVLEDHLSHLDAAEANLKVGKRKVANLEALIAESAYRGSLRHESDPIAEALLSPTAPRHRKVVAQLRNRPEWSLPAGWAWASVDEVSTMVIDGDHNPPRRVAMGIPHITARGVRDGAIVLDRCTYVSAEGFAQTSGRYLPAEGDVVVTCVGTIGRVAVVPSGLLFSADRNLAAIRVARDRMLPHFLALILTSVSLQRRMQSASSSTAQPHLYLKDLRSLPIAVPPLEVQNGLVSAARELLSAETRLIQEIETTQFKLAALRRSTLEAAFCGRLSGAAIDSEIMEELAGV